MNVNVPTSKLERYFYDLYGANHKMYCTQTVNGYQLPKCCYHPKESAVAKMLKLKL